MQDTIAKFKEEKRAQYLNDFRDWRFKEDRMLTHADITDWSTDYWLSKMPELLTLLEEQVGEKSNRREITHRDDIFTEFGINQERQRIRNLLSLTKQQF